jgi:uncharacterized protein YbjT (DUF2867 family)
MQAAVFITGGTGYIGRRLTPQLLARGHAVRALVRPGSESKLPPGATPVFGDALDRHTFAAQVKPADTFVHLIGVPHPSPRKAEQFKSIDLASLRASVSAAVEAGVRHFVYVSVAHPAPVMKAYVEARQKGEEVLKSSGLSATVLRPWYVLGPGHRWPYLLLPLYWLFGLFPSRRPTVRRLGLVTLRQMTNALVWAVEHPPALSDGTRVIEVPEIRTRRPRPAAGE